MVLMRAIVSPVVNSAKRGPALALRRLESLGPLGSTRRRVANWRLSIFSFQVSIGKTQIVTGTLNMCVRSCVQVVSCSCVQDVMATIVHCMYFLN